MAAQIDGAKQLALRALLAAGSGLALAAGHPPWGIWAAAPLGVALLTLATYRSSIKTSATLGLTGGAIYFGIMTNWVAIFGGDAFVALLLIGTAWFTVMGAALGLVSVLPAWPVTAALIWSLQELLFARAPFGGFPWGRLAYSQVDSPAANLASIVGISGLSMIVALSGTMLAYFVLQVTTSHTTRSKIVAGAGAIGAIAGPLTGALIVLETSGQNLQGPAHMTVALIQGGQDPQGLNPYDKARERLQRYGNLTRELATKLDTGATPKPDLVIWPENSANLDPYNNEEARELVDQAVTAIGIPTLVGAVTVTDQGRGMENRAVIWTDSQGPGQHYTKTKPVPFGEYLPGRPIFTAVGNAWPWLSERFAWLERDFVNGSAPGVLGEEGFNAGVAICFEVAYDTVMRELVQNGSRLIVIPTNNALWSGSAGVDQQFAIARMRAIEHNRTTITAATTGTTAVIRPDGSIQAQLPPETKAILEETVALRDNITPAVKYGAAIETVLLALGALALGIGAWHAWVKRPRTATTQRRK